MTINIFNISRLRTYSDGNGTSTLIGCMGCPLRCAYCLNPYSWDGSSNTYGTTTGNGSNNLGAFNIDDYINFIRIKEVLLEKNRICY